MQLTLTSKQRFVVALLGMALTTCAACSRPTRNVQFAPVSGKVTYKKKPVPKGQVTLVHTSGEIAIGEIQPDGSYAVQGPIGDNQIMIEAREQPNSSQADPTVGRHMFIPPPSLIPERYCDYVTSGLKLTVVAGDNIQNWDLKD